MSEFIEWGLSNLKPEDVKKAIEEDIDLSTFIFDYFKLHKFKSIARIILRAYWKDIERYLSNPDNIYRVLARKPKVARILQTSKGQRWLYKSVRKLYEDLYYYTWS